MSTVDSSVAATSHPDAGLLTGRPTRFRVGHLGSCVPRSLAFHGRLNGGRVRKVLRSARSQLGGDQIVLRDKERREASLRVQHSFNAAFPCGVKIDARQAGDNVEASRIASKAKEAAGIGEFLRANAFQRCAERGKRGVGCPGVRRVRSNEKVDVLGKAGLRVKDDSVSANNQVSNAMGMEGGQKVFVILVHLAASPTL